jgi:nucleotide-binding universal stress UspA family protein
MSAPVIAAIDLGPLTGRVLYHAAAFARLLQVPLKVLHVGGDRSPELRERVANACLQLGPYETDFDESQIVLRTGRVSDAIAREAIGEGASLIVIGSRGRSGVARLLLGSTSESVLKNATTPVLIVPPTDIDIVNIGDHVALTSGPIVAAVDLAENSSEQVRFAGKLAAIGKQPLVLMTVARSRVTDYAASQQLRDRAHGLPAAKPAAVIVRRGAVAEEISRCALVEGAGLVVMGLRATPRCQPGAIASAVLRTKRAFVLAVPTTRMEVRLRAAWPRVAQMAALILALLASAVVSAAQREWGDVHAIAAFQRAADSYAFVHRQVERQLGSGTGDAAAFAAAILRARPVTPGRLFAPAVVEEFRSLAARATRAGCNAGELRTGTWDLLHSAGAPATGTTPVAACLARHLPVLPPELEYRSAGTVLVVVDVHANLVVDVLPALLAGSELR